MTTTLSAIEQRAAALQSTFSALGSQLASAASSEGFAGVLDTMQQAFAQLDGTAGSASLASSGSSGSSRSTVLGAGLPAGSAASSASSTVPSGAAVVSDAAKYLGVPYRWGGTDPTTGFDCSGFVQHVYGDLGISLPRTSQEQSTVGVPVPNLSAAQPGDLLFFEPGPTGPGHVGIYIGGGQMIDAPHTGTTVQIQPAGTPCAIRRIIPSPSSSAVAGSYNVGSSAGLAGGAGSLSVPPALAPLFLSAGAKYGVSPTLLAAVAQTESGFDPSAVSSAGAEGLMQIMPGTAQGLGINPMDPAQAVGGAAQILAGNLHAFGSVPLALAAYNAGAGAVQAYGGIPPYPQTQAYVARIMGLLGVAS